MSSTVEPQGEEWRDVRGHGGYQVSNFGRVRSNFSGNWRVLKPGLGGNGYYTVALGRGNTVSVHRLVAEAFLGDVTNRATVNHKDGVRTNNLLANLEWATYSNNVSHGRRLQRAKGNYGVTKLSAADVPEIRSLRGTGLTYAALSDLYNVSRSALCHVIKGRTWSHLT